MLGSCVVELAFNSRRVAEVKSAIKEMEMLRADLHVQSDAAMDSPIQTLLVELDIVERALIATAVKVQQAFTDHHGLSSSLAA